ncbi:MAG: Wzz/FepE/Etk N-terminal domain-containing protein [Sedimenticola sp.]
MNKNNNSAHSQEPLPTALPYLYYSPDVVSGDEISLTKLWQVLAKRKMVFLVTVVLTVLTALGYTLVATPIYKAEAIFLPPPAKDVQIFSVQGMHGQVVDSATVYKVFQRNLRSHALQRRFFEEQGLIDIFAPQRTLETPIEGVLQSFSKVLTVRSDKKNSDALSLSIEWRDPELVAQWVNQFTALVDSVTVNQFSSDLEGAIANRIKNIENTITSKRALTKQRREDEFTRLEEALQIAQSLGINERINAGNMIQKVRPVGSISVNTVSTPLYIRGTKALKAEITVLRNRKVDDAFIPELRNLQEELSRLRSISIDVKGVHAVTIDQTAYPPTSHIKPKRTLIVALGVLLGLMLGVFAAFFMHFLDTQRKETETAV